MSVKGQALIDMRRKQENKYNEMESTMLNDRRVLQIANFENTTQNKIENRLKKDAVTGKKKQYEQDLLNRRKKIADLYNDEIEMWRAEILAKVETQEDRKARIMERAYALREARETDRQKFVHAKLEEQWRDANDDARTLDSKAMTLKMNQERIAQIQEKISRKQNLSSQENSFLTEWKRQLDEMEKRNKEKEDNRRRIDHETSNEIRNQIAENARRKEAQYYQTRMEEDEELAKLRKEIEDEEEMQQKRQIDNYYRGKEVLKFNAENQRIKQEELLIEKEHDAILLDYAIRKENEANMAESLKRNANREAAVKYRKYLEEQMIKEAEDTAFVDEIRKREEEKVWKARDDALKAREDARNYLMQTVDQGRQEQIKARREQLEREKYEGAKFASKFLTEAEEAVLKEKEDTDRRRQIAMDNKLKLSQQIEYRKYKEELEKQEAYLADKQMQYIEREHRKKLAEQGGVVRDFRGLKKNNWYT
eukprot:gene9722-13082_t